MTRIAIFALLGCSFLSVQAHVVRERALSTPGLQLSARPVSRRGPSDSRVPGLGGGTTRALQEASETRGMGRGMPSVAPAPAISLAFLASTVARLDQPPHRGTAPPILRI